MAAYGNYVAERRRGGNLWKLELAQRNAYAIRALLGDDAGAIAMLRSQVGRPGFRIHSIRNSLEMIPLWDHPDFIALVADRATNAPLPLETPVANPAQR